MSAKWTTADIPDQTGRTATGANSGLGLVTARELARKGAKRAATDEQAAARLRGVSEQLTGVRFELTA
jgi:NAD(P)-dependent dehydrogenase (short-subunit alcohol dehydrogenase family)